MHVEPASPQVTSPQVTDSIRTLVGLALLVALYFGDRMGNLGNDQPSDSYQRARPTRTQAVTTHMIAMTMARFLS
jgi:hypothetical protein